MAIQISTPAEMPLLADVAEVVAAVPAGDRMLALALIEHDLAQLAELARWRHRIETSRAASRDLLVSDDFRSVVSRRVHQGRIRRRTRIVTRGDAELESRPVGRRVSLS